MRIVDDTAAHHAQHPLRVVAFVRSCDDVNAHRATAEALTRVPRSVVVNDTFLTVSAP